MSCVLYPGVGTRVQTGAEAGGCQQGTAGGDPLLLLLYRSLELVLCSVYCMALDSSISQKNLVYEISFIGSSLLSYIVVD